jgi:hypothetical protein
MSEKFEQEGKENIIEKSNDVQRSLKHQSLNQ